MGTKKLNKKIKICIEKETIELLHVVENFYGYEINQLINDILKDQVKIMLKSRGIL